MSLTVKDSAEGLPKMQTRFSDFSSDKSSVPMKEQRESFNKNSNMSSSSSCSKNLFSKRVTALSN